MKRVSHVHWDRVADARRTLILNDHPELATIRFARFHPAVCLKLGDVNRLGWRWQAKAWTDATAIKSAWLRALPETERLRESERSLADALDPRDIFGPPDDPVRAHWETLVDDYSKRPVTYSADATLSYRVGEADGVELIYQMQAGHWHRFGMLHGPTSRFYANSSLGPHHLALLWTMYSGVVTRDTDLMREVYQRHKLHLI